MMATSSSFWLIAENLTRQKPRSGLLFDGFFQNFCVNSQSATRTHWPRPTYLAEPGDPGPP